MNIKNLFQQSKTKKLNNTIRRAAVAEDYDAEEPNVRLSRAFIVVMLLHLVAVGGIFAFSSLKKNTPHSSDTTSSEITSVPTNPAIGSKLYNVQENDTPGSIATSFGITREDMEKANSKEQISSLKVGDKIVIPPNSIVKPVPIDVQKLLQLSKKTPAAPPVKELVKTSPKHAESPITKTIGSEDKVYIVQKGDNPVTIAKKIGVSADALAKANNITDPRKLQIGQQLVIPPK